jgi:hypothetical protein
MNLEVNRMGYALLLEIPEEIYQPLVKTAQQSGHTPEELVTTWLTTVVRQTLQDPLEQFIGAFHSNIPDWANQHDRYLGQALFEQMRA